MCNLQGLVFEFLTTIGAHKGLAATVQDMAFGGSFTSEQVITGSIIWALEGVVAGVPVKRSFTAVLWPLFAIGRTIPNTTPLIHLFSLKKN